VAVSMVPAKAYAGMLPLYALSNPYSAAPHAQQIFSSTTGSTVPITTTMLFMHPSFETSTTVGGPIAKQADRFRPN
jgi:hypothetical protein